MAIPDESLAALTDAEIRTLLVALGDAMREASSLCGRRRGEPRKNSERASLLRREVKMLRASLERVACSMSRYKVGP